jgi:glycosyltransferase involved in cell wall biosynthesis
MKAYNKGVICIHIGARAHYLFPKALQKKNELALLITDTWIASVLLRTIFKDIPIRLIQSFGQRYTSVIPSLSVVSSSIYFAWKEIWIRYKYKGWSQIIARNKVFQQWANTIFLKTHVQSNVVLGISYTARDVFETARKLGKKTILYQMDPGLEEERIVARLTEENKQYYPTNWHKAPVQYWNEWEEECMLADVILVNSDWSRRALLQSGMGIDVNKIHILPLPFEIERKHMQFNRTYPEIYSTGRPLVCLYLGTLTLRKGIHLVLDVAHKLKEKNITFILVGENELDIDWKKYPNVSYQGICSREETDTWYQRADVFLFPTLSDGFGLTQLEAMAWKLPVIASTYCGDVVKENVNGLLLKDCHAAAVASCLERCLEDTSLLPALSVHCLETLKEHNLDRFAEGLSELL